MFTLIGLGTGVAWAYSVVATLVPGLFPAAFRTHTGVVPAYFEAAAVIVTLVLLGQVLVSVRPGTRHAHVGDGRGGTRGPGGSAHP
jgi:cation transport ATPase